MSRSVVEGNLSGFIVAGASNTVAEGVSGPLVGIVCLNLVMEEKCSSHNSERNLQYPYFVRRVTVSLDAGASWPISGLGVSGTSEVKEKGTMCELQDRGFLSSVMNLSARQNLLQMI